MFRVFACRSLFTLCEKYVILNVSEILFIWYLVE